MVCNGHIINKGKKGHVIYVRGFALFATKKEIKKIGDCGIALILFFQFCDVTTLTTFHMKI
jgi:hypothetical protein